MFFEGSHQSPLTEFNPDRSLLIYNPNAGGESSRKSQLAIEDIELQYGSMQHLETNHHDNVGANLNEFRRSIEQVRPTHIIGIGGDSTARIIVDTLIRLSQEEEFNNLASIPLILMPRGTGNDIAKSAVGKDSLDKILNNGRFTKFHPIKLSITAPDSEPITYYVPGSVGVGAFGNSALEINREEVRQHDHFEKDISSLRKNTLLGRAALKGYSQAESYISQPIFDDRNSSSPEFLTAQVFFHARRFGIYAKTHASFGDEYLHAATLYSKCSPRTLYFIGRGLLAKVPTETVTEPRKFIVEARHPQQALLAHMDDTSIPLESGSVVEIGLADEWLTIVTSRKAA